MREAIQSALAELSETNEEKSLTVAGLRRNGNRCYRPAPDGSPLEVVERAPKEGLANYLPFSSHRREDAWASDRYRWRDEHGAPQEPALANLARASRRAQWEEEEYCSSYKERSHRMLIGGKKFRYSQHVVFEDEEEETNLDAGEDAAFVERGAWLHIHPSERRARKTVDQIVGRASKDKEKANKQQANIMTRTDTEREAKRVVEEAVVNAWRKKGYSRRQLVEVQLAQVGAARPKAKAK